MKTLNPYGYTRREIETNEPLIFNDPMGTNPGPIYHEGPIPIADYQTGNAILDNTIVGAVNTCLNCVNSLANAGLNGMAVVGDTIAPYEGAIISVSSGLHPMGKVPGQALGMVAGKGGKLLSWVGRLGKPKPKTLSTCSAGVDPKTSVPNVVYEKYGTIIHKEGNTYIKQVNPNSSKIAQKYAKSELDAQVVALEKLGDMAPPFTYKNGVLRIQDAGKYDGNFFGQLGGKAVSV